MSPSLKRFVNDIKSPLAEPTTPLLPKESAPLCTLTTPFQWISCVLATFSCVGMVLAIPPVAAVAAFCAITQTVLCGSRRVCWVVALDETVDEGWHRQYQQTRVWASGGDDLRGGVLRLYYGPY
ncbi:hypothetical protein F4677DRAFT_443048 [Hypoxylon crocopeplum]|nr:hypothetical protein F4677DRAFT_443048 [Hypoxylon crocopeplum]